MAHKKLLLVSACRVHSTGERRKARQKPAGLADNRKTRQCLQIIKKKKSLYVAWHDLIPAGAVWIIKYYPDEVHEVMASHQRESWQVKVV